MKAVATKNSPKESRRPNLVIDTDVHTKKKTWQHLFQKDRTSPKLRISKSSTTQSLPTPPPTNPMKEMERAQTSDDYSSISGVQSVFKKLQMSQRNKKRYSSDMIQISDVPEPVMPSLVNWSPEAPISPPPWEYDNKPPLLKRHSSGLRSQVNSIKNMFQPESDASGYHSDNEITKLNRHESTHSIGHSSDVTLVESRHSNNSSPELTRRSSCPNIADDDSVSSSSTLASVITPTSSSSSWNDKDIIAITEQHTRRMTGLKKYVHPVEKQPTFKPCQKAKARAAEVAASGNTLPPGSSPSICSIYDDNLKYLYIPNVFDPITNEPVLEFTSIRPRRFKLHRKTSWKKEAKALMVWQQGLKNSLSNSQPSNALVITFFFFF
jgi:hypothetical protein